MKYIEKFNRLFLYIFILIQYIKENLCIKYYKVSAIDPLSVKVGAFAMQQPIILIILICDESFGDGEREEKVLILQSLNDNKTVYCPTYENQDEYIPEKIIFQLDQRQFLNKSRNYGKYMLFIFYS